ncbi:MAG: hypothetical protein A2W27_01565 [Deltaproteobacteria bacterium RBG_16_44_11]|nr:MAG: hypothetical protein A2W27_01565 [Deltaproteobacteria bacterium RBG_16_44_11]
MTSKKQRRSQEIKGKKKKKSTKVLYLSIILGAIFMLLVLFFVILFNAVFPPVDTASLKKEKRIAIIYFSDQQERFLMPEKRYVIKEEDTARQAEVIVKALLEGSKEGLVNTFPAGVTLNDVDVDNSGTALVNFNENLTQLHPGGSTAEMATIYSLTNSLTENVEGLKRVKILVEGRELSSIKGHISTRKAFRPDPELIVKAKEGES